MLMVVGGAIIVLVAWINMTDVGRRAADVQTQTKLVQVSVGGGLWLTLIGGVGLGLTGLAIGNLQRVEAQTKTASSVSSQEPMPKPEPPNLERQQDAPQSHSPAEEVARFAKLRDQGVLTPEEFEAKKKQLLGL
ncbi:MAG: SHOCT domain-containing protein [Chloroflexi bacterium]|nr:SHOCT domain-containing protein [Chloroflexota bacterium]